MFSHEDSPLHLFHGPGQILLQTASCVMPDYGIDPDMPTDDASLPTVRRMTHTTLLSVPCLTRPPVVISPSPMIISVLAGLGDQPWFPLPRPLPYDGLPPEPPATILLHLLSEDDPRSSLDLDDTYWEDHESHRGCSRCAAVCATFRCLRVSVRRVRRFVTMVDRANVDGGVFGAATPWVNGTRTFTKCMPAS